MKVGTTKRKIYLEDNDTLGKTPKTIQDKLWIKSHIKEDSNNTSSISKRMSHLTLVFFKETTNFNPVNGQEHNPFSIVRYSTMIMS